MRRDEKTNAYADRCSGCTPMLCHRCVYSGQLVRATHPIALPYPLRLQRFHLYSRFIRCYKPPFLFPLKLSSRSTKIPFVSFSRVPRHRIKLIDCSFFEEGMKERKGRREFIAKMTSESKINRTPKRIYIATFRNNGEAFENYPFVITLRYVTLRARL